MTALRPAHLDGASLDLSTTRSAWPTPSAALREAIARAGNPHPDAGADLSGLTPALRAEAGRHLKLLEAIAARIANADDVRAFLQPLALAKLPNGPRDTAEAGAAVQVFFFVFQDLPAAILTPDRAREGLRTFRFWPSPAEWRPIIEPPHASLAREIRLTRALVTGPANQGFVPPTDAERVRIHAGFAALAAELRSGALREAPRPAPRPAHLAGSALDAARAAVDAARRARDGFAARTPTPARRS